MIFLNVCMDVYVCVRACVRACVCIYAWISASTRSILTGEFSFSSFFLCDGGSKIRFLIGPMRFCFISNFLFSQNLFLIFFLMIGSRYLNRMGSIWKRNKIPIFSKKKVSSYHGSFIINKNVFFLKLITLKLNGQFFW